MVFVAQRERGLAPIITRMVALRTLILLGLLVDEGRCPEFPSDPTLVVPDSASVVLGVDVDAFAESSTGKGVLPALGADLQIAEAVEAIGECGLAIERTYAVVLARDRGDGRMFAVQARGLGEAQTLTCLANELHARNDGIAPWVREQTPCFDSLAMADGSRIWIANDYTLVWARGSFVDPVAARMTGATPLGLPQGLAEQFDVLDRSRHLWLAAILDEHDGQTLPGGWNDEAESLTVAMDFSDGLKAVASVSATKAEALASIRDLLLASLVELADRLDEFGVEHRLGEHARIGMIDGAVVVRVELDEGELRAIRRRIGEHIQGRGPI